MIFLYFQVVIAGMNPAVIDHKEKFMISFKNIAFMFILISLNAFGNGGERNGAPPIIPQPSFEYNCDIKATSWGYIGSDYFKIDNNFTSILSHKKSYTEIPVTSWIADPRSTLEISNVFSYLFSSIKIYPTSQLINGKQTLVFALQALVGVSPINKKERSIFTIVDSNEINSKEPLKIQGIYNFENINLDLRVNCIKIK